MDGMKVSALFGYAELVQTSRWEGSRLIFGSYVRRYDRDGVLVETTEPSDNGVSLDFGEMPDNEVQRLCAMAGVRCDAPKQQSAKKRGFVSRFIAWCSKSTNED